MNTNRELELITEHIVNPANDRIKIEVLDEPGAGGACHLYRLTIEEHTRGGPRVTLLQFQNGAIAEEGVNGITHEALLAVLAHRLRGFQNGPFACMENAVALSHIETAQAALHARTRKRMERGVEGTLNP